MGDGGLEERLRRCAAELESLSYSVSHDLRAPLRALSGFSRLLREQEADRVSVDGRHMLERIQANAERMDTMIEAILRYSRIGHIVMAREPVDMAGLAGAVADELKAACPAARVAVGSLPEAFCDAAMVRQVWAALIGNALKFAAQRERPEIEIGARDAGGATEYFVRDNGAGFDMAGAGRLFGLFQRMHGERSFPGIGAGLAIARRIVERHGGSIRAEAVVDGGATFGFTLAAPETKKPAEGQAS